MALAAKRRQQRNRRPARQTSNIFAMFEQSQIAEFKEAFTMIDQNKDSFIDKNDLRETFNSLGKEVGDDMLENMLAEGNQTNLNFTMFLTLFGEKLQNTDSESVLKNAFACFDEGGTGYIPETRLKELLMTMGERFSEEKVEDILAGAPIDANGNFNYDEFVKILKHGAKEKDE